MPKQAIPIHLREGEQAALLHMTKRHKRGHQLVIRAQIVLAAAEGKSNVAVAQELSVSVETVRLWRNRWATERDSDAGTVRKVEERLADAPRSGTPAHIGAEQRCQMELLACEVPSQSGRPISQWSGREIAEEMIRRGIVERISRRHAARLLKKGGFQPHLFRKDYKCIYTLIIEIHFSFASDTRTMNSICSLKKPPSSFSRSQTRAHSCLSFLLEQYHTSRARGQPGDFAKLIARRVVINAFDELSQREEEKSEKRKMRA